jgi:hypothetical protein
VTIKKGFLFDVHSNSFNTDLKSPWDGSGARKTKETLVVLAGLAVWLEVPPSEGSGR